MINKSVSLFSSFVLISNCALLDLAIANTITPSEPLPDLFALGSTYPAANSVNYNASPNPQFTSNNFNNFNEQIPPTPNPIVGNYQNFDYSQHPTPNPFVGNYQNAENPQNPTPNPIAGNYQNAEYSQKPPHSIEPMISGNYSPESKIYDFGSDLKNTLVTMKDNLGLMADTQRLLANSLKAQHEHYNDIEKKLSLDEQSSQRNYEFPVNQQTTRYQSIPPNPQPVQYQSIPSNPQPIQYQSIPALPPLPYGQQIIPTKVPTPTAHHDHHRRHHKKHSHTKSLINKIIKKKKPKIVRRLPLLGRDTGPTPLERRAEMALRFIRNGVAKALWTALIVACVKLVPIVLFGFKLMFQSVVPLTGLALFRNNQGLFRNHVRDLGDNFDHEDAKIDVDDEVDSDDDSRDDISDVSDASDSSEEID